MAKKEDRHAAFHKRKSMTMLIVGILILINELYGLVSWGMFVGGVITILGLIGLIHPKK